MPRRSGKSKSSGNAAKSAAGPSPSTASMNIEEQVLQKIFRLYKNPSKVNAACGAVGIEDMSLHVGKKLLHPSRRCRVLLVGNHSAGKSSFINWYCQRTDLQPTGVAVETQGFTIVTQGQREELVKGDGAVEMKPFLEGIEKYDGVLQHLEVRVSTSNANEFATVDLIDTPGLITEVTYPFDVNAVIQFLAKHVDLIFVFMDPHGQAMCKRTMDVVNALDKAKYGSKMSFFITKADQIPGALDRQNIITQTVATLSKYVTDHHGLKVHTMWISNREGSAQPNPESNYLGQLVKDIRATVKHKVQVNMSQLQDDCKELSQCIDREVEDTAEKLSTRCRWLTYKYFIGLVLCPMVVIASFLDMLVHFADVLPSFITSAPAIVRLIGVIDGPLNVVAQAGVHVGFNTIWYRQGFMLALFLFLFTLSELFAFRTRRLKYRSKQDLKQFREYKRSLAVMCKAGADIRTSYLQATQRPESAMYG